MEAGTYGGTKGITTSPEMMALIDLIQALVSVNKRIMTLTNILGIQKKLMRTYPSIILKMKVDRNFDLTCKMEGTPKHLEALGKFLEEYLKELMEMLPSKNLSDRIYTVVANLGKEAALELLASGAADLLPVELIEQIRIAADFGDRLNDLRSSDARTQATVIYEELYSRFMTNVVGEMKPPEDNFKAFCRKLEKAGQKQYDFIIEFEVKEDYRIVIEANEIYLEDYLDALAHIYESLVYGASTVWDEKEVKSVGRRTALTVLGDFEDIPDASGVTASLLKGALSSKVRTGTLGFDRLLDGGLERKTNTLLVAPNIIERDFLLASYIRKGFQSGEEVLAIVTKMDIDRILDMLTQDNRSQGQLGKFNLHMYMPKEDENEDRAYKAGPPTDLSELNKLMVKVVKDFGPGPKRALIEILDESKKVFGDDQLYWYLTRYLNILKDYDFTTIFLADIKVLGKEFISNILDLFENTIEIRKRSASYSYEIGRVAAKKMILEPEFRILTIGDRGVSITDD